MSKYKGYDRDINGRPNDDIGGVRPSHGYYKQRTLWKFLPRALEQGISPDLVECYVDQLAKAQRIIPIVDNCMAVRTDSRVISNFGNHDSLGLIKGFISRNYKGDYDHYQTKEDLIRWIAETRKNCFKELEESRRQLPYWTEKADLGMIEYTNNNILEREKRLDELIQIEQEQARTPYAPNAFYNEPFKAKELTVEGWEKYKEEHLN